MENSRRAHVRQIQAVRRSSSVRLLIIGLDGATLDLIEPWAAAGDLPVSEKALREAIRTKTKKAFVDTNLKCFDLGFQAAKAALDGAKGRGKAAAQK